MGINRNIVECKEFMFILAFRGKWVLIETLWNVKILMLNGGQISLSSINRNIVECKG